uniref:Polycystin 1L3 n=1 Tax=Tetraselmis sp. GSL018 TaxID=582737 RepID=A0A061RG86_9CHLO
MERQPASRMGKAASQDQRRHSAEYQVTFWTSDKASSAVHGQVLLWLVGTARQWGPEVLSCGEEGLMPGTQDTHLFTADDIGDILSIRVKLCDPSGGSHLGPWLLETVEILRMGDGSSWRFPAKFQQIPLTIHSDKDAILYAQDADSAGSSGSSPLQRPAKLKYSGLSDKNRPPDGGYRLTITTSKRLFAGTDAQVQVELLGVRGSSSWKPLNPGKKELERGRTDIFWQPFSDTPYLGAIQAIRVHSDNSGRFPGWYPKEVELEAASTGERWKFVLNCWIDRRRPLREFKPGSYSPPLLGQALM